MGLCYRKHQEEDERETDSAFGLTRCERKILLNKWSVVYSDNYYFATNFFLKYIHENPAIKKYFPFRRFPNKCLMRCRSFEVHALNFFYLINEIMMNLDNAETVSLILHNIKRYHRNVDLPRNAFRHMLEAFSEYLHDNCIYCGEFACYKPWRKFLAKVIHELSSPEVDDEDSNLFHWSSQNVGV